MNTRTKVSLGIAAAAAVVIGPFAVMAAAQPGPLLGLGNGPAAASAMWGGNGAADPGDTQGGWGMHGRGGMMNGQNANGQTGRGMMNGAGYGAGMMADYLADELGVSAEDVATAMRQYHVDNPNAPMGRPDSQEDAEARQGAMATYLAKALGVSADDVEEALDAHMGTGPGCAWN